MPAFAPEATKSRSLPLARQILTAGVANLGKNGNLRDYHLDRIVDAWRKRKDLEEAEQADDYDFEDEVIMDRHGKHGDDPDRGMRTILVNQEEPEPEEIASDGEVQVGGLEREPRKAVAMRVQSQPPATPLHFAGAVGKSRGANIARETHDHDSIYQISPKH